MSMSSAGADNLGRATWGRRHGHFGRRRLARRTCSATRSNASPPMCSKPTRSIAANCPRSWLAEKPPGAAETLPDDAGNSPSYNILRLLNISAMGAARE